MAESLEKKEERLDKIYKKLQQKYKDIDVREDQDLNLNNNNSTNNNNNNNTNKDVKRESVFEKYKKLKQSEILEKSFFKLNTFLIIISGLISAIILKNSINFSVVSIFLTTEIIFYTYKYMQKRKYQVAKIGTNFGSNVDVLIDSIGKFNNAMKFIKEIIDDICLYLFSTICFTSVIMSFGSMLKS